MANDVVDVTQHIRNGGNEEGFKRRRKSFGLIFW